MLDVWVPDDGILCLDTPKTFSFPRGIDRVVFWEANLDRADRWLKVLSHDSVGNSTILVEGVRFEYAQVIPRPPAVYVEQFIVYGHTMNLPPPAHIASVLLRESNEFNVIDPICSPVLQSIVEALRQCPLSKETNSAEASIVISDRFVDVPPLLVTEQPQPRSDPRFCLIAKWADVCLYRIDNAVSRPLDVVKHWKDAPAAGSFVWTGTGSSGAAASLAMETGQRVLSYPSGTIDYIGIEKKMRHNFFREDAEGLRHGVWIDVKLEEAAHPKVSSSAWLRVTKPGVLNAMEWVPLDPDMYPIKVEVASLNFRDVVRATGLIKEPNLAVGLEFSGYHKIQKLRVFGLSFNAIATHCCKYSKSTKDT